ncbi:WD40 repeat-like protein [Terfezia boudieri ATCC MYA-4762]|uniref:Pre-rRNA-processing protein IPI3 n=1 Tax=Terfezia boudieri ATCC MYA-4762 TaxID=1051890 RepID=A0A3N4L9A8_9PEZI|nr:WD40 repeat-like protein [Terfezia boudieri ATCC MYA-4762]
MLSEQVLVGTLHSPTDPSTSESTLSIYDLHTYKHLTTYKRSSTAKSGLAVTSSHIYAAQADKAVINVYDRSKGTLASTVPFTEQFTVLAASHGGAFIAGGTENGRLTIWEVTSGRFISTGHTHLQRVTTIAFDPTDTFIITGSADSNAYVWSVAQLTDLRSSADRKPERILDHHQREITSIVVGRANGPANIAITASKDLSCIVWNYQTGLFLRRFLFRIAPLTLALDPVDRAFYAGFQDGSIQCIDFHGNSLPQPAPSSTSHRLFGSEGRNVPITIGEGEGSRDGRKWVSAGHDSPVTAIAVLYEGNFVVTGNERGEVCVWDVATGSLYRRVVGLKAPITALHLLPPTGFLFLSSIPTTHPPPLPLKPRYESLSTSSTTSSSQQDFYFITSQFLTHISPSSPSQQPTSYSSFRPANDLSQILSSAREMSLSTGSGIGGGLGGVDPRKRVEDLESELVRMHRSYEQLVGLHKGLWERQARWMVEVGVGGEKGGEGDDMEE